MPQHSKKTFEPAPGGIGVNALMPRLAEAFDMDETAAKNYVRTLREAGLVPSGVPRRPPAMNLQEMITAVLGFTASSTMIRVAHHAAAVAALERSAIHLDHRIDFPDIGGEQRLQTIGIERDLYPDMVPALSDEIAKAGASHALSGRLSSDLTALIEAWTLTGETRFLPSLKIIQTQSRTVAAVTLTGHPLLESEADGTDAVYCYGGLPEIGNRVSRSAYLPRSAFKQLFTPFREKSSHSKSTSMVLS